MAKKTERKKLTDKLDELCRDIIRIRDDMTCQRCHKQIEKSNAHCSHVIPKSRGNNLRWNLINLKLLCMYCHLHWWHKDIISGAEWFKSAFPARHKYLESRKNDMVKFSIVDLKELLNELREKYNDLQNKNM